jgi:hypothetical protein
MVLGGGGTVEVGPVLGGGAPSGAVVSGVASVDVGGWPVVDVTPPTNVVVEDPERTVNVAEPAELPSWHVTLTE